MDTILSTGKLITPHEEITEGAIAWDGTEKMIYSGSVNGSVEISDQRINEEGLIAAPSTINFHIQGLNTIQDWGTNPQGESQ